MGRARRALPPWRTPPRRPRRRAPRGRCPPAPPPCPRPPPPASARRPRARSGDAQTTTAGEVASSNLITIDPDQDLDEALRMMAQHQVRRLPVVEEDGHLVGILAQADAALEGKEKKVGETLEQISR